MTSDTIRVFLCDDHTLFRDGIKKLLQLEEMLPDIEEEIEVVGEASNGVELLKDVKKASPDVILMDISMPQMDGVTASHRIKKILPSAKIIILTVHEDEPHIFEAIKAGAMGYLLKDVSINELLEAIRMVYKGEALIQPVIATKLLKEFALLDKRKVDDGDNFYNDLTEREKEVLRLIALGGTNKEIAARLDIAEKTVKNHISKIFQTLHVNTRTKAALYALGKKP
ncbi:MAG: response regulator transcription factor [Candidatus Omnitrophica bacterium]|nr:response regulator transcription factor [Candidatus Omnitrophota bacterium]